MEIFPGFEEKKYSSLHATFTSLIHLEKRQFRNIPDKRQKFELLVFCGKLAKELAKLSFNCTVKKG